MSSYRSQEDLKAAYDAANTISTRYFIGWLIAAVIAFVCAVFAIHRAVEGKDWDWNWGGTLIASFVAALGLYYVSSKYGKEARDIQEKIHDRFRSKSPTREEKPQLMVPDDE